MRTINRIMKNRLIIISVMWLVIILIWNSIPEQKKISSHSSLDPSVYKQVKLAKHN